MDKVFDIKLFKITLTIEEPNGSSSSQEMKLVKKGDKFIDLKDPHTNMKMPVFKSLVKPGFTIKSDADATSFEAALDVIYPIHRFGNDKKHKAIRRGANKWTFIRGDFFKDLSGFIVTTDAKARSPRSITR